MHFCTVQVAISGDIQQVVHRNAMSPVSWPEVEVLRFVHGEDAITEIKPIARIDQGQRDERERLTLIYGREPVEKCFGARNSQIEMEAYDVKLVDGVQWLNPITNHIETTGGAPPEPEDIPVLPPRVRKAGPQNLAQPEKPF
jgi:hypothetical protein